MELRQLEYVVAVVDHGTFTRAAEAVHVAQPTLSQGIRALEIELGVELFHRIGRRVVLADAGAAFVGPARQTLRDAAMAVEAVAAVRGLRGGRLVVATLPTLAVAPLAAWVGAFRSAYPGVQVQVVEPEDAPSVERLVCDGGADVGLAEAPDGAASADLVGVPLGEQAIVAIAPAGARLPASGRVPLRRLATYPLVTTPAGTSTRNVVDAAFARAGVVPQIAVETTNREALIPLVAAGAGITFLPRSLATEAVGRGLRLVLPEPAIRRRIALVHRAGAVAPAVRAFLDVVAGGPGGSGGSG